jgi:hypothetical protein
LKEVNRGIHLSGIYPYQRFYNRDNEGGIQCPKKGQYYSLHSY